VEYKVNTYYAPELERGIRHDDPAIGIEWPVTSPILSPKDVNLPTLAEAEFDFIWDAPNAG
jgi:dTDP-4-dehydrorhamnose 3,5-epimerase